MAPRASSALVLLALFAVALLSLQVALADEAGNAELVTGWKNADVSSNVSPPEDLEVEETDSDEDHGMSAEADHLGEDDLNQGSEDFAQEDDVVDTTGQGEIQPYVYVPSVDEVDVTPLSTDTELDQVTRVGAHPLARILRAKPAQTKCWTTKHCQRLVTSGACCKRRCADLATSNTNCGRCNRACDTRGGYACHAGQCVKQNPTPTCARTGRCRRGKTCCKGQCRNLQTDASNCGRCRRTCAFGSACCCGHCKKLKTDCNNCGKCGRRCRRGKVCCNGRCVKLKVDNGNCGACGKACGYGRKCCNGHCVSVVTDKNNCGRCCNKCPTNVKCQFGICGYGH